MAVTTGTRIGPYEVRSMVGEGGMGVVFRALDTRLQRDVALKLLPDHLVDDGDRLSRFRREAQVLASLNHPNIAQIYGLEETDNAPCIVMEFLEGETLQDRLKRGPIEANDALAIAKQIAAGLAAAHEKGIVHHDLKPGNVHVTSAGLVKVLDFGLAVRVIDTLSSAQATQLSLTLSGSLVGTLAYMAPELLRGQRADFQSDIWAFGVTLYEMIAAARPFHAPTPFELSSNILNDLPAPLPVRIPDEFRMLILRCLNKDRGHRYAHVAELRSALEIIQRDPIYPLPAVPVAGKKRRRSSKRIRSLAVLPLANLSNDPEQEYFSDGMTDALVSDLAKIQSLRVISRTSAMQ